MRVTLWSAIQLDLRGQRTTMLGKATIRFLRRTMGTSATNERDTPLVWPRAGEDLLRELVAHPGRVALVAAEPGQYDCLVALANLVGEEVLSVGRALTDGSLPEDSDAIERAMSGSTAVADLDILFWRPWLKIEPIRLLTRLARRRAVVAAWPGVITEHGVTYSQIGRPDRYEAPLADALVLHPKPMFFPDQTPFDLERRSS